MQWQQELGSARGCEIQLGGASAEPRHSRPNSIHLLGAPHGAASTLRWICDLDALIGLTLGLMPLPIAPLARRAAIADGHAAGAPKEPHIPRRPPSAAFTDMGDLNVPNAGLLGWDVDVQIPDP